MSAVYSLDKLLGGALAELFSEALVEVAENVLDPNTKPDAEREILMSVKIKPSKERDIADMSAQVKAKLAPHIAATGRLIFDRSRDGKAVCGEFGTGANSNQVEIAIDGDGETTLDTKDEFKGLKVVQ